MSTVEERIRNHKYPAYNFMGRRKLWYALALLAIIPGLIVAAIFGLNQGIDFTGGTILQVEYSQPVELAELRVSLNDLLLHEPTIQEAGDNQFLIRTAVLTEAERDTLLDTLAELGSFEVLRNESTGSVFSMDLLRKAQLSMLIAAVLILGYVTIRFRIDYAIAAIAALVHDVLVIISVFAVFRFEVNSYFVAALLTTVGYSINNTIVVFDRIRENEAKEAAMALMCKEDGSPLDEPVPATPYPQLVNDSINQTLTRSVNTVAAVMLLLLSLLILGGSTIRMFIIALCVGMVAGFFSSLCLVGSLLVDLQRRFGDRFAKKEPAEEKEFDPSDYMNEVPEEFLDEDFWPEYLDDPELSEMMQNDSNKRS